MLIKFLFVYIYLFSTNNYDKKSSQLNNILAQNISSTVVFLFHGKNMAIDLNEILLQKLVNRRSTDHTILHQNLFLTTFNSLTIIIVVAVSLIASIIGLCYKRSSKINGKIKNTIIKNVTLKRNCFPSSVTFNELPVKIAAVTLDIDSSKSLCKYNLPFKKLTKQIDDKKKLDKIKLKDFLSPVIIEKLNRNKNKVRSSYKKSSKFALSTINEEDYFDVNNLKQLKIRDSP
jgi:hypothetical protein